MMQKWKKKKLNVKKLEDFAAKQEKKGMVKVIV